MSVPETTLAHQVFDDSLPSWGRILITDALSPVPFVNKPFTEEFVRTYFLNVGPDYYSDMTRRDNFGFGSCRPA